MNIAVIGADAESVHAIEQAGALGHNVIAVDIDPKAPGLAHAGKKYNIDISKEAEVIEALKDDRIDLVLTTPIGAHIRTVGAVNDAFSLPGISRESAALCSDKYAFHNRLRNVRLRDGHCYLVNAGGLLEPDVVSYPAVFKPRFGSHGRSVHFLNSADEFADLQNSIWSSGEDNAAPAKEKMSASEFAAHVKKTMEARQKEISSEDDPDDDYILEEAFPGTEYTVDGFVEGCNFEMILLRRKELTPPPARQAVSYTVVMPGEDDRAETLIREYMNRVCEAVGFRECMIHADVCVLGHTVNIIEVSPSPAGRHVYDELIPMATGVDPVEQYVRYMSGRNHFFEPLNMKKMMLRYFDMEHCFVHGIPDAEKISEVLPSGVRLRSWTCNIRLLDYMGSINDEMSLISRGYYIIEARSDELLRESARIIMNSFDLK